MKSNFLLLKRHTITPPPPCCHPILYKHKLWPLVFVSAPKNVHGKHEIVLIFHLKSICDRVLSPPFDLQIHNEFLLPSEKEGFIHRMGDIIKRAEALMSKEKLPHISAHRLAQAALHGGVNSLSSSQVSSFRSTFVFE